MTEIASAINTAMNSGYSIAEPHVISVYFAPAGTDWYDGSGASPAVGWNDYQITQVFSALEQWSNVANVQFVQTDSRDDADFQLGITQLSPGLNGLFFLPDGSENAGIGSFTSHTNYMATEAGGALDAGGIGYDLLLHETGHGLGLLHPYPDDGNTTAFPGVSSPDDLGLYNLNQGIYTVMTSNPGWVTGPDGVSPTGDYGYAFTPMPLDIAVIQSIYGANTTYENGNTNYYLPDQNASGTGYQSIFDTGGNF